MQKISNAIYGEISSVQTQIHFECAYCIRKPNSEADQNNFKLCSGCYNVRYCKKECQLADRKRHKLVCNATKAIFSNSSVNNSTEGFNNVLYYCSKDDLEGLQREISRGVSLMDFSNEQSFVVLSNVVVSCLYKCAELLLRHNINPNVHDMDGYTPLLIACQKGYEEFVSLLLRYKADPNIVYSKDGYSPLHVACSKGHDKCVALLLQNNANPNLKNSYNDISPLLTACQKGHDKCVSLLLHHNAQVNTVNMHGDSALHSTCQYGHDRCALLLLQHNADPNVMHYKYGCSPLYMACQNGHDKCLFLLLQYNADPNIINNLIGCTALHIASQFGHDKCLSLLLEHDVDPNKIESKNGMSPLYLACQYGHDKCVSLLLKHKVDSNIVNKENGCSPLHRVCQQGRDTCVSLLLQAGANMECMDITGFTPLLTACYCGYLKCAALLVEHGANIHARTAHVLQSTVALSCISGNINLVAYILSLGVDVNQLNVHGFTTIQYCYTYKLDKCVKLLIEHGADESTMKTTIPADLIMDKPKLLETYALTKASRQKAKHCDYPDCCNEGNDSQPLHACSSCRAVYYCSREHQEAHWKEHKKLCKAIKK